MDPIPFPSIPPQTDLTIHAPSGLWNYSSINASAILELGQRHTLQVIATTTSSISLFAALCAVYWFLMMQRNFRRDLVLLLILGGSWKSLWFFTFSVVTFSRGPVKTQDVFCQASGYCLQAGFEACDIAVFFMSMHMYYQIFPPSNSFLGHDGLYRVRRWVVAGWLIFPNLSASLAFVNPRAAFMAQGAFCSIPLRPFWYRLGLFWIPRYLIWMYIVFVAVRIYRHVGSEFRVFGEEKPSWSSVDMPGESSIDRVAKADLESVGSRRHSIASGQQGISPRTDYFGEKYATDDTSIVNRVASPAAARRQSMPNPTLSPRFKSSLTTLPTPASSSNPTSRRGSQQVTADYISEDFASFGLGPHRGSIVSISSEHSSNKRSGDALQALSPIAESGVHSSKRSDKQTTATQAMRQRRRAIQRQLRLLFIYPVVYMLLWIIPFVVNVMNYTTYFAQNPVFPLQIVQLFMLTVMTHVDVVVFSWRERPWRHIPGSDGTFLGSFMWWRFCFDNAWAQGRRASRVPSHVPTEAEEDTIEKAPPASGLLSSIRSSFHRKSLSPRHSRTSSAGSVVSRPAVPAASLQKRTFSGGSDRKQMEVQRAHERLALERADYEQNRTSLQEARISIISSSTASGQPGAPGGAERKDWFDRVDGELFEDSGRKGEKPK